MAVSPLSAQDSPGPAPVKLFFMPASVLPPARIAVAGEFFPATAGDDAARARQFSDQPPAGNPRAHPRQGRANTRRSTRTNANCGCARRNCAGICCRCCAMRRRTATRDWRRSRTTCANWSKTGSRNGTFCRRRCSRNFWTTNAPCAISRTWTSSNSPPENAGRTPPDAERALGTRCPNRTAPGLRTGSTSFLN